MLFTPFLSGVPLLKNNPGSTPVERGTLRVKRQHSVPGQGSNLDQLMGVTVPPISSWIELEIFNSLVAELLRRGAPFLHRPPFFIGIFIIRALCNSGAFPIRIPVFWLFSIRVSTFVLSMRASSTRPPTFELKAIFEIRSPSLCSHDTWLGVPLLYPVLFYWGSPLLIFWNNATTIALRDKFVLK